MGLRDLKPLTMIVTILVVIDALVTPVILLWAGLLPESYEAVVTPMAATVDGASACFTILTTIVFSVWIYQAGTNLLRAGFEGLEFTPGSRIWWFAVPIACLFKPFQGMRELWNASHNSTDYTANHEVVSLWWAAWIGSMFFGLFAQIFAGPEGVSVNTLWLTWLIYGASAVTAIILIHRIANAQSHLSSEELGEVFA